MRSYSLETNHLGILMHRDGLEAASVADQGRAQLLDRSADDPERSPDKRHGDGERIVTQGHATPDMQSQACEVCSAHFVFGAGLAARESETASGDNVSLDLAGPCGDGQPGRQEIVLLQASTQRRAGVAGRELAFQPQYR